MPFTASRAHRGPPQFIFEGRQVSILTGPGTTLQDVWGTIRRKPATDGNLWYACGPGTQKQIIASDEQAARFHAKVVQGCREGWSVDLVVSVCAAPRLYSSKHAVDRAPQ
jgi:hypothetical protein